jgi:uncharacterized protein YyaL (SSP411 family)
MPRYANVWVSMIVSFLLGMLGLWGYPAGLQAEPAVHPVLPSRAELFMQVFRIDPQGNFREGKAKQHNIPHLTEPLTAIAARLNRSEADLQQRLEISRQRIFNARAARPHPFKDDTILTDWNGLMIAALAKAGQALQEPSYIAAAQRAADFMLRSLRNEDGRLHLRWGF